MREGKERDIYHGIYYYFTSTACTMARFQSKSFLLIALIFFFWSRGWRRNGGKISQGKMSPEKMSPEKMSWKKMSTEKKSRREKNATGMKLKPFHKIQCIICTSIYTYIHLQIHNGVFPGTSISEHGIICLMTIFFFKFLKITQKKNKRSWGLKN